MKMISSVFKIAVLVITIGLFGLMTAGMAFGDCSGEVSEAEHPPDYYEDGIDGPYTDNGDGTVTDQGTDLIWQQAGDGKYYKWEDACAYCDSLTLAGYSDWELPDIYQLESLVDENYDPTINTNFFSEAHSSSYWSGTVLSFSSGNAWYVHFSCGRTGWKYNSYGCRVRCVRPGSSGSFDPLTISITASEPSGASPLEVSFDATIQSGTSPYSYSWAFDDGSASTSSSPVHTYTSSGNYTATVTVSDGSGQSKSESISISVSEPATYSLNRSVLPSGTGVIQISPDKTTYNYNETVALTAVPNAGYRFTGWSGDASGTSTTTTLTMTGNKSVTASFSTETYTLTVNSSHGSVIKDPDKGVYNHNETVTLTAVPDGGYTFTGWSGDASGTSTTTTLTMTGNKSVTASFSAETYTLTVNSSHGSVIKDPDKGVYNHNETVTLTAVPDGGYTFTGWSGDASGNSTTTTVVMTSDKTVTAAFEAEALPVPKAPVLTGSISGIHMEISWAPIDTADGYTLFFSPYTGESETDVDPAAFDSAPMETITQLSADLWEGAAFYVAVQAYNTSGAGAFSNTITLIVENTPPPGIGKAIILAGGGGNTTLYPYSNKLCQQMYRLLKQRGFTDDDIIYMNPQPPDIDEDGHLENERLDYELFDPENELKDAFARAGRGVSEGDQFILYVHGHADSNFLKITREYEISSEKLKELLNQIPDTVQQVVILDTCYSGSFLDDLSGHPNRIVLTSADDTVAWNVKVTNYSDKFIRALRHGNTLKQAFEAAEDMISGDPVLFGGQAPQMDDNSDGVYTSRDGTKAGRVYLGKEGVQAAEPPAIIDSHSSLEIPAGKADALLWVKTSPSGDERIKKVTAVLMPPDFQSTQYAGEKTDFSQIELELKYNGALDRYEVLYDNFRMKGEWRIMYQVQGADGAWSETKFVGLYAGGAGDVIMTLGLNQTSYVISEKLDFDVTLNGETSVDMYVAVIFPQGYFQTFSFPQTMGPVNVLQPYQSGILLNGQKKFSVLEWTLPRGLSPGNYHMCAMVTTEGNDPWDIDKWYAFDCLNFTLK